MPSRWRRPALALIAKGRTASDELVGAPSGVSFGLTFLLAFVFGSIPAAIGAGALYGVSLADADWLHGAAESLLAITNCVVVLGFRGAIEGASTQSTVSDDDSQATERLRTAATAFGGLAALSAVAVVASGSAAVHTPWLGGVGNLPSAVWATEPSNALSVPTWIIHTSSLVEWLVAMGAYSTPATRHQALYATFSLFTHLPWPVDDV